MDRQQYLDMLLGRTALLQTASGSRVNKALTAMKAGLSVENDAAVLDLVRKAAANPKGPEDLQLAEIRIETVNNFIWASSNALTFFDEVSLAPAEEPFLENTSRWTINVDYVGQDGRPKKTMNIRYQDEARVDLHTLSTEELEYVIFDIYKGDVRSPQLANVDMAYELMMKVDGILWPFIKNRILPASGGGSSFNFSSGARSSRVFVPHPNIATGNLPTSNYLVPDGNSGVSTWRKDCLDLILIYVASWGSNAFRDGPLKPMTVYMPSSDVMGLLNEIQIVSEAFPNAVVEQILETGFILSYGGVKWSFVGDSTLDPDDGMAYVRMNKPIGTFYTKPAADKTLIDRSTALAKENKESISMTKVIGTALPTSKIINVVGIRYRNAR